MSSVFIPFWIMFSNFIPTPQTLLLFLLFLSREDEFLSFFGRKKITKQPQNRSFHSKRPTGPDQSMYCLLLPCHCGGVLHSKDPFSTCPGELNSFLHRVPHLSLLPALSAFYSLY
jgi:hypothetical protein